jgi:hypothetical protein
MIATSPHINNSIVRNPKHDTDPIKVLIAGWVPFIMFP